MGGDAPLQNVLGRVLNSTGRYGRSLRSLSLEIEIYRRLPRSSFNLGVECRPSREGVLKAARARGGAGGLHLVFACFSQQPQNHQIAHQHPTAQHSVCPRGGHKELLGGQFGNSSWQFPLRHALNKGAAVGCSERYRSASTWQKPAAAGACPFRARAWQFEPRPNGSHMTFAERPPPRRRVRAQTPGNRCKSMVLPR